MKKAFLAELTPEQPVRTTLLVQSKERKTAANGSAYLDLDLRDSSGSIKAKYWDCDRHGVDFDTDDIVKVDGMLEEYRGTPQLKIRKIARCTEEVDLTDYFPHSARKPDEMLAELVGRVNTLPDGPMRMLLLSIFEDPAIAAKYKLAPAATSYHHAYLGGLIEHVLSLLSLADRVLDHYGDLNRDLVVAGLVLHDLGKIEELSFDGGFRYTTRGQLLGHISIGLGIVQDKMRAIPDFPVELRSRLEHIILSHHGKLEFGSPKEPMFPEALVVHYLDDLDSKLASMRAQYVTDKNHEGEWTTRNRALGRELLKYPKSNNGK